MQRTILVVCDRDGVGRVLNDLVHAGHTVEWAQKGDDALTQLKERKEFDLIIVCLDDGLADADELAADLKMESENMPIVIVAQNGVVDDGRGAGIALGNIDAIVPEFGAEPILEAFGRISGERV